MSRVKLSWASYICTIHKNNYIAMSCVWRMFQLNKHTFRQVLKDNNIKTVDIMKKTKMWYYLTFDALHQCMLKIMHWSPDKAAAAIKELERVVKTPSSFSLKTKEKKKEEDEEDSSFVGSTPTESSSSLSQDAAAAAAIDVPESYSWWPEFCNEMYRLTNPATFTTVLQSQELKAKCTELLDMQVESKIKRNYDEAKEEFDALESVHKRLKTNLKERVQKEVDSQCRREKTTLFKMK